MPSTIKCPSLYVHDPGTRGSGVDGQPTSRQDRHKHPPSVLEQSSTGPGTSDLKE